MRRLFYPMCLFSCLVLLFYSCKKDPVQYSDIRDFDGNTYSTLELGSQVWLAENLKTTHYSNGDPIPLLISDSDWIHAGEGAYSKAENSDSLAGIYGLYYNGYCIADERGLCPQGWHVPDYQEWHVLIDFLGGDSIAGGKLKEAGNEHWQNNAGASNLSGMSMLPGGYRSHANGWSNSREIIGFWWSGKEIDSLHAFGMALRYYDSYIYSESLYKKMGASVRCVRD